MITPRHLSRFKKSCLAVLFVSVCTLSGLLAQSAADSLIQLLPKTTNDTARARLYKAIVEQFADRPEKALYYTSLGMKQVSKMGWSKGIGVFNGLFGRIYTNNAEYAKAKPYILRELKIHQQNHDSTNIASSYSSLGTLNLRQGQYTQALQDYLQALRIAELSQSKALLPIILDNIAIVYFDQNHFDKALAYSRQALRKYQEIGDTLGIASTHASIANKFQLTGDTAKAILYYQKAIDLLHFSDRPTKMAEIYQNQALLIKQLRTRLQLQLKAQAIWDQTFPAHQLSITNLGNIGWSFLDSAKHNPAFRKLALEKATKYFQLAKARADSAQDHGNQHFLLGLNAELEAAKSNYPVAYQALYKYHEQYDSLYSQESKNKLAEAESNYFLGKKNAEIAIQKLTISNQRKIQWIFALGSLLLLVIAFLFYRLSQIRRKSNQQLLQLNQSLDQANRQKAQLLAVLSHDLRYPLSNLIGLLDLQKNAPDLLTPEASAQHRARIASNTEVLLENLENMLVWSKEQMNQAGVDHQNIQVSTVFERLRATFSDQDQLNWSFDYSEDLWINTDPNYLWIMLQNLSSNASKALKNVPQGKIQWKAWSEGNHVWMRIQDNGTGFPASILQHFNANQKEILYSGFGLQVVHDFALKLNINLTLENLEEGGASVLLSFD